MPNDYTLDNQVITGKVVISISGHPCYIAETMHTAEEFAARLSSDAPIELPAQTDSTAAEQINALVDRVLHRIVRDGSAQAMLDTRDAISQHITAADVVLP